MMTPTFVTECLQHSKDSQVTYLQLAANYYITIVTTIDTHGIATYGHIVSLELKLQQLFIHTKVI